MIDWTDATSYQRDQRGKIEPTSWEAKFDGARIWVSRGHIYYPNEWIMDCESLGVREQRLHLDADAPAEIAQVAAIRFASRKAKLKAQQFATLAEILSEVTE